jgi:hypothetical protein
VLSAWPVDRKGGGGGAGGYGCGDGRRIGLEVPVMVGGLSVGAWRLMGGCSELELVALRVLLLYVHCMECGDRDMGGMPWTWSSRVISPDCG